MEILPGLEIVDLALKYKDILIIGDLHLGFEESLIKQGVLVPFSQLKKTISRLEKIIKKTRPRTIIINGDLKDEFGTISRQEWNETFKFIDFIKETSEVVFIRGNHDTILDPIARKKNIDLKQRFDIDDITIVHGDKLLKNLSKTLIISHEHPAISFNERPDEKFKCFLSGKFKSHNLIVIPSFNLLLPGSDITKEEILSPYIKNIKNFKVFIVQEDIHHEAKIKYSSVSAEYYEDGVFYFGKLKNLQ